MEAIAADHNQYAITWGVKPFRDAIVEKRNGFLDLRSTPNRGHSNVRFDRGNDRSDDGAVDEGEEVVVFEPFYENYTA